MKSRMTPRKVAAVLISMIAGAILWAAWGAVRVSAVQDSEDMPSPFGVVAGQTARLSVLNIGERAVVGPEYRFLNSEGLTLARTVETNPILPAQFRAFDFELPDPPPGILDLFGRPQVRAVVIGNPDEKLHAALEVFDNATGKTTVFIRGLKLSPPPEPD